MLEKYCAHLLLWCTISSLWAAVARCSASTRSRKVKYRLFQAPGHNLGEILTVGKVEVARVLVEDRLPTCGGLSFFYFFEYLEWVWISLSILRFPRQYGKQIESILVNLNVVELLLVHCAEYYAMQNRSPYQVSCAGTAPTSNI